MKSARVIFVRNVCLLAPLLFAATAFAENDAGQSSADVLQQLVGDWELETSIALPNGGTYSGKASQSIRAILDGRGIQIDERQPPPAAGRPAYTDTTIYYSDPSSGRIKGASLNSQGNRKLMEGTYSGGQLVLTQTGEFFGGREGRNRLTWFDIHESGFSMRLDSYDGNEGVWKTGQYSVIATRHK